MEEETVEFYQNMIDSYARLIESEDFKVLVKEAKAVLGGNDNLRGCKTFEIYLKREGYIEGMERILFLPQEIIKNAKARIGELNNRETIK